MRKIKNSRQKKIIAGAVTVATLAISFSIISSSRSEKAKWPTISELNEIPTSNDDVEKLSSAIILGEEMKDVSSSDSKNGNQIFTPKDKAPKAATEVPKADKTTHINKYDMPDKREKMLDFSDWNRTCAPTLVVVNKANPIPENYPISLENYNGKKINAAVKDDLDAMIHAAAKDSIKIFIYSGYRTIEEQTRYFKSQTSMYQKQGYSEQDAQAKAAMSVARPRTSEHNTGLAIDFNCVRDDFYKTKEYAWLIKNAAEYGFILRYAKDKIDKTGVIYEPWHFRYVGKELSQKIMASGLSLEEYIVQLQK